MTKCRIVFDNDNLWDVLRGGRRVRKVNIAITGKMRSGKDTIAEYLVEKYGYKKFSFGGNMKKIADQLFGGIHKPSRSVYQKFAQLCREIDPDVWIKQVDKSIIYYKSMYKAFGAEDEISPIVISDLRQPNEYDYCKRNWYFIVRVTTPEDARIQRIYNLEPNITEEEINHCTEGYVDNFKVDYEILNDGTIEDLFKKVDKMVEFISSLQLA